MPAPGLYDLTSDEAQRGGEWLTGIARVMQARFSQTTLPLLAPYLDIVRAFNPQAELKAYPGSPLIARALLRPQDRLTACEVEPNARKRLIDALRRDTQARVVDLDGWVALPAFVPPNERRGLVLIDPPYEAKDEFERIAAGFAAAFAKWPTGSYLLWYPAKSRRATDSLARHVARAGRQRRVAGKMPAARIQRRAAGRRRRPDLGGAVDGQSAMEARWPNSRRSFPNLKSRSATAAPAGSGWRCPSPRVAEPWAGSRLPGRSEKSRLSRRQLRRNRIMLGRIRTGFTFRFREWLRRSDKASIFCKRSGTAASSAGVARLSGSECPVEPTR